MARTGSTTSRTKKSTQPATEAVTTEANEEATVNTDTVEATVAESTPAETTEAPAEATEATEAPAEKPAEVEIDLTAFKAAIEAALTKVTEDGKVPTEDQEPVQAAYRDLEGAKAKNVAKKALNDMLRDIVSGGDIVKAQGVMDLVDAVASAGSKPKPAAERKPADPVEAFIEKLVLHNLAYNLVAADVPDGVDESDAKGKATEKVGELTDQADQFFAWTQADAETRGDEPEVNALVKRAVRLATGKVSAARTSGGGTSTPHEGPRGNTARHIQLVFQAQPIGTVLKVAEIAKAVSTEYPNGKASPGAINARLKSNTPIEGIEACLTADSKAGARKTAEVAGL